MPNLEDLLTQRELQEKLGLGWDAIKRFRDRRVDPLPFYRIGRLVKYDEQEVVASAKRQAEREQAELRRWMRG